MTARRSMEPRPSAALPVGVPRPSGVLATAALLAPLSLLAGARLAHADSCGGGGNHDGHHGHSSWSGDLPGRSAPPCEDGSQVVGYRRCTRFGAWGTDLRVPRLSVEGGVSVRQFGSLLDSQTGEVIHDNRLFLYRVAAPPPAARAIDTAVVSTIRASMAMPYGVYTALELGFGGIVQPGRVATEMMTSGPVGTPSLRQERGLVVDSLATVGLRGSSRAGSLAVEMSGGMRAVSYYFHSDYLACESTSTIQAYTALAEARVRGELWLSPWLTAGVTVGTSMLERDAWMGGLYFGVHTRTFGGSR